MDCDLGSHSSDHSENTMDGAHAPSFKVAGDGKHQSSSGDVAGHARNELPSEP